MYTYFISYAHSTGFGNFCMEIKRPITDIGHVRYIEGCLREDGVRGPVVLNYELLNTD